MIPRLGRRKRQQRRSEKHGFVIRVRDQEADALVAQVGGGGAGHLGGVEPACGEQDRDREVEIKGHGRGRGRGVIGVGEGARCGEEALLFSGVFFLLGAAGTCIWEDR